MSCSPGLQTLVTALVECTRHLPAAGFFCDVVPSGLLLISSLTLCPPGPGWGCSPQVFLCQEGWREADFVSPLI